MISVIIPVYNVKPYLKKCIESIINQSYRDLEIIIVDDGSNDGTQILCDEYAAKDKRIRVIHQENKGQSVARNTGLDVANGEWISFVDSDDWLDIDMYKTLIELSLNNSGDIISCKTCMHYGDTPRQSEDSLEVYKFDGREAIKQLLTQNIVRFELWNKIWKKAFIGNVRFVEGQLWEEVHFDLNLFLKCKKFVYIDKSLYNYRVNREGATNSSFKINRLSVFEEFDSLIEKSISKNDQEMVLVISTMGCSFAYRIFSEALWTKQSGALCKKIYNYFKKYYILTSGGLLKPIGTRIVWKAFLMFPRMTVRSRDFLINGRTI